MELDLSEAVAAFKIGWERADKAGLSGHRTEAGMAAAAPFITDQVLEAIADGLHQAFPVVVPPVIVPKPPLGDDIYNLQAEAAGHSAYGYWELARNCEVIHPYGGNNWRPAKPAGRHEHWIDGANISAIDNYSDEDD